MDQLPCIYQVGVRPLGDKIFGQLPTQPGTVGKYQPGPAETGGCCIHQEWQGFGRIGLPDRKISPVQVSGPETPQQAFRIGRQTKKMIHGGNDIAIIVHQLNRCDHIARYIIRRFIADITPEVGQTLLLFLVLRGADIMESVHRGRNHGPGIVIRQQRNQHLKTGVHQAGMDFIPRHRTKFGRHPHASKRFIPAPPDGFDPLKLWPQMNLAVRHPLIIRGTVDFFRATLFDRFDIHGSGRIMALCQKRNPAGSMLDPGIAGLIDPAKTEPVVVGVFWR